MRLARVALLLALAGALLAARWPLLSDPAPAAGGGGRDAAVVVGLERHMLVARIPGAEANAIAWYDYLVQTRGIPIAQAALLVDGDATREEILSAAKRASAQVQRGGTLWFVFVGHGAPARANGDGLLVGFDAQQKPRSIRARSVAQSELLAELQESRAASIHVFLDACFSGRTSTGGLLVPGLQPLEVVVEGPSADPRTLLFTAARGDEYAGPLPGGARPAFSYLALGGLRGWADRSGDREITAAELHRYVADALGALLRDRDQTPTFVGAAPDAGARVLAQSPGEHGPDLAHVAREIASDDRRSTFQPTAPRRIERPVRAAARTDSTACSTFSSSTAHSRRTFGKKSTRSGSSRYRSRWPFWRPYPRASMR